MIFIRPFFWLYRYVLSPALHAFAGPGYGCRFPLSCSRYFERSLQKYGALRGARLGFARLSRCHPWGVAVLALGFSLGAQAATVEMKTGQLAFDSGHTFVGGYHSTRYPGVSYETITRFPKGIQIAFDSPDLSYLRDVQGTLKNRSEREVEWTYEDKKIQLTRVMSVAPGDAYLTVTVSGKFKGVQPKFAFASLFSQLLEPDLKDRDRQLVSFSGNSLVRNLLMDGNDKVKDLGPTRWVAATNRYFAVALVAQTDATGLLQPVSAHAGRISLVFPVTGSDFSTTFRLYVGPKDIQALRAVDPSLDQTVDLGMFTIVAYPILRLLQWIYSFAKNYGVAIILLTLLIKLVTYPLTFKSMKSMRVMAKMQPEIAALRERYKDNTEQMNRELMAFMRSRGYNPIAGCLPMLIQMPVFFALYQVLYSAVELYQAPFFGWINDLSEKDPYFITPVVLTVTMFIQQKTSPQTMTDPMQRKLMNFMPVVFGLLMLTLPSGLTLYMLVNALASIAQQKWMNKQLGA